MEELQNSKKPTKDVWTKYISLLEWEDYMKLKLKNAKSDDSGDDNDDEEDDE